MKPIFLLFLLLSLSGCGIGKAVDSTTETVTNKVTSIFKTSEKQSHGMSEEQIKDIIKNYNQSHTSKSLSIFIWIGGALFLVGAVLVVSGISRSSGLISMGCGAGSAFIGYAIEEYALEAICIGGGLAVVAGCFEIGYRYGEKLGFEKGKDFKENQGK
jgi:hypothetical protein